MNKPAIQEQIDYLAGIREQLASQDICILAHPREREMFKVIQENLIAIRNLNEFKSQAVNELGGALTEAVSLIKQWHNMQAPEPQASLMWKIYSTRSPEMQRITQVIMRYTEPKAPLSTGEGQGVRPYPWPTVDTSVMIQMDTHDGFEWIDAYVVAPIEKGGVVVKTYWGQEVTITDPSKISHGKPEGNLGEAKEVGHG